MQALRAAAFLLKRFISFTLKLFGGPSLRARTFRCFAKPSSPQALKPSSPQALQPRIHHLAGKYTFDVVNHGAFLSFEMVHIQ